MEQNKIPPTPWESKSMKVVGVESTRIMDCHGYYVAHQEGIRPLIERDNISNAIVTAVNFTYGASINPEAVPDLLRTLKWLTEETGPNEDAVPSIEAIRSAKAAIEKAKL